MRILAALLALACAPQAFAAPVAYIIWHAGQSNAMGDGDWRLLPDEWLAPDPSIPYQYRVTNHHGTAAGTGDFQRNLLQGATFGAEITMVHTLADRATDPIYAGKSAQNGAGLGLWWIPSQDRLFPDMIQDMQAMKARVEGDGYEPHFVFTWTQSSADARSTVDAPNYYQNLIDFADGIRAGIGDPEMPFIQTSHPTNAVGDHGAVVNQAKLDFTALSPHNYLLDIDGIPLKEDNVHYAREAYLDIGYDLADLITAERLAGTVVLPEPTAGGLMVLLLACVKR